MSVLTDSAAVVTVLLHPVVSPLGPITLPVGVAAAGFLSAAAVATRRR